MPTYVYRCTNDHTFEVVQRMSDDPVEVCEVCGASVTRLLFAPAIHFKGSGFHNTDYGTRKRPVGGEGGGDGAKAGDGAKSGDAAGTTGGTGKETAASAPASGGKTVGLDKA